MNATTMQTHTGKLIDLREFSEADVRLPDISHALSMLNRFTGHTTQPYSVAQHSVVVSKLVPQEDALWGLLHDASEAYLGDVARPLKAMLPEYVALEKRIQQVIARAFGLRWPAPPSVKAADNRALIWEKQFLLSVQHDWGIEAEAVGGSPSPLGWQQAKELFESRFLEVKK
jgi:hypothetical protein